LLKKIFILFFTMTGVWVQFDDWTLKAYGVVLEYLFKYSLSWAYEPDNPLLRLDLEKVLTDNKSIDAESFMGYFYLWNYVSTRLPLPIPHLERIIPYVISRWNTVKGGSDAITKLLWLNMYTPPRSTPQSHAISRMILLGLVVIHCLNHFFTSKSNLKQSYQSLSHFHKAASIYISRNSSRNCSSNKTKGILTFSKCSTIICVRRYPHSEKRYKNKRSGMGSHFRRCNTQKVCQ
jgi:hypothetical protein